MGKANPTTQFCFATGIQGSARLILGNKGEPRGVEEKGRVLTSRNVSSLVIDSLCDRARDLNFAVSCFYFDFTARKEQSATSVLGSLLKQMISGMERIPEEISQGFQEQEKAIGGRGPQLVDIVKMLQDVTSSQPTFICVDALDECAGVHRARLLRSLKQILKNSPGTRIFMTGRPYIRAEIEEWFTGQVISISVSPTRGDIITYLRVRLREDEIPDAMDDGLEADIMERIPGNVSETCVGQWC